MRFFKICWVLSKYLVFYKLTRYRKENFGSRLRRACDELGIIFVKIGQILSTRHDLLPREYCLELQGLLNSSNPVPFAEIAKILEQEYGPNYREIFKNIFEQPLGSASVSQVHKAELADGTVVAVKVRRPFVDRWLAADMRILRSLAGIGWLFSRRLRRAQILNLVDFFESWIRQDIDFKQEVQNNRNIREQYNFAVKGFRSDLGRAVIVATHDRLCTQNVIVMDFVDGIPLNRKAEVLADKRYDPRKSIKSYASASLRNWFRDDLDIFYFQADPHLSNLLALPGGDGASIDHGLIGALTKPEAEISKRLVVAVYLQDVDLVMKVAAEIVGANQSELEVIRPELVAYLQRAAGESFGYWFEGFGKIIVDHNFKFPSYLITLGRAQLMIEGMIHEYMPEQTTVDILGEELRREALRQMLRKVVVADWVRLSFVLARKIQETPKIVEKFINNPLKFISEVVSAVRGAA